MSGNTFLLSYLTAIIAVTNCVNSEHEFDTNSKVHPFATFIKRPVFYPIPGLYTPPCTPPGVTRNCMCGEVRCDGNTPNCALAPTGPEVQCTALNPCARTSPRTCTCGGRLSPGPTQPYCNPRSQMWVRDLMIPGGNCYDGGPMDCLCGDGFMCVDPTPFCNTNTSPAPPACIAIPTPCTTPTQPNCACGFPITICRPDQTCVDLEVCEP